MKQLFFLSFILLTACNSGNDNVDTPLQSSAEDTVELPPVNEPEEIIAEPTQNVYANARFREVRVEKTGERRFLITGKGQIFEASFSWVVEDGHDELKQGFEMTDAGAPEWGNFIFTVDVAKKRPNSTLTLILFESSAMDGSRQHELPITLK